MKICYEGDITKGSFLAGCSDYCVTHMIKNLIDIRKEGCLLVIEAFFVNRNPHVRKKMEFL